MLNEHAYEEQKQNHWPDDSTKQKRIPNNRVYLSGGINTPSSQKTRDMR